MIIEKNLKSKTRNKVREKERNEENHSLLRHMKQTETQQE